MGIAERRERERLELRKKILDAARELFVKRGYEAVTMREIARRIEYSPTALYGHFEDKETLVRELCRRDFAAFSQAFLSNVASSGDPAERLCHAGLVYLSFAEQYPEHYRLMFLTEVPEAPPTDGRARGPGAERVRLLARARGRADRERDAATGAHRRRSGIAGDLGGGARRGGARFDGGEDRRVAPRETARGALPRGARALDSRRGEGPGRTREAAAQHAVGHARGAREHGRGERSEARARQRATGSAARRRASETSAGTAAREGASATSVNTSGEEEFG